MYIQIVFYVSRIQKNAMNNTVTNAVWNYG